ncbi:DUF397 domain-containing protein [Streptomyces sp. NPDC002730]|uniref:DUF397 domain-containing protein n=1 Tax=Streptomyces sp. NPDC002730 TaxID=3364662 RepID=UPI0036912D78
MWRGSGAGGDDCLEVADGHPDIVPVHNPHGPELVFRASAWASFVADLKQHWPAEPLGTVRDYAHRGGPGRPSRPRLPGMSGWSYDDQGLLRHHHQ